MTNDFLSLHIPHRIILLTTFRERFWSVNTTKNYEVDDLFRCSKDISMLMVRFFLGEMGINLKEGATEISDKKVEHSDLGIQKLTIKEVKKDRRYQNIFIVLKTAN